MTEMKRGKRLRRAYWLRWGWSGGRPGSSAAGPLRSSSLARRKIPSRAAGSPERRSARRCCTARSPRSSDAFSRSCRGPGLTLGDGRQKDRTGFDSRYLAEAQSERPSRLIWSLWNNNSFLIFYHKNILMPELC